ncbi:MAG: hypothetical protein MJ238_00815 [Bacilli bacterium]|nr:hypothetical protein [Bacilli bacterium]
MSQTGYIIIAISIVVILVALFTISFVAYVKTPAPAGCEAGKGPNCENCEIASCRFYASAEERAAKKRQEETMAGKE